MESNVCCLSGHEIFIVLSKWVVEQQGYWRVVVQLTFWPAASLRHCIRGRLGWAQQRRRRHSGWSGLGQTTFQLVVGLIPRLHRHPRVAKYTCVYDVQLLVIWRIPLLAVVLLLSLALRVGLLQRLPPRAHAQVIIFLQWPDHFWNAGDASAQTCYRCSHRWLFIVVHHMYHVNMYHVKFVCMWATVVDSWYMKGSSYISTCRFYSNCLKQWSA